MHLFALSSVALVQQKFPAHNQLNQTSVTLLAHTQTKPPVTEMKANKTITLTLTETEFFDMRTALSEASSSWFEHYKATDFDINSGERLVYDARCRLRDKFVELYNKTFLP